jgi:hypothetical protein
MSSDEFEERIAELDRMQEEEEYVSMEEGNNEHLLGEEWDYSNSD